MTTREFLSETVLTRDEVDRFLDPRVPNYGKFDPELGYTLRDCQILDGIDRSHSLYNYHSTGERKLIHYADRPCRINTYGDSMTQCHQVSDGETWQEVLAAHLGEPIRNFGVGGYGVYQAALRLRRHESGPASAPYLVFNIYPDDHLRSLDAWRWLRLGKWWRDLVRGGNWEGYGSYFNLHANPWKYLRVDPASGRTVERENPCPTPESLYQLCDPDFVWETFHQDLVVQILVAKETGQLEEAGEIVQLAQVLGVPVDLSCPAGVRQTVEAVHWACALRVSQHVVEQTRALAKAQDKKLMVLLSYSTPYLEALIEGQPRVDQGFLDHLKISELPFVDTLDSHVQDYARYKISVQDYAKQFWIPHYTPLGNHFFAFAIKDAMVNWLDPKPITYRSDGHSYEEIVSGLA